MYQFSYAEIVDDAAEDSRARERRALDRSIELMEAADAKGPASREAIEALLFVRRLWTMLIEDLGSPENSLPQDLRASLISIGLWLLQEAERIRIEEAGDFKAMIDISTIIRAGLK
jgi:flagellar protein FlaF